MKSRFNVIMVLIAMIFAFSTLSAQINWTEYAIDSQFDGAWGLYVCDMGGDGDIDVLGTAEGPGYDGLISWWESDLVTSIADRPAHGLPDGIALLPAYPNFFNANTTISYTLSSPRNVIIDIFDLQGRKLQTLLNKFEQAGLHKINFNASDLASGVYFYCLQMGQFSDIKKMLLIK